MKRGWYIFRNLLYFGSERLDERWRHARNMVMEINDNGGWREVTVIKKLATN